MFLHTVLPKVWIDETQILGDFSIPRLLDVYMQMLVASIKALPSFDSTVDWFTSGLAAIQRIAW